MTPRIVTLKEKKLIGNRLTMSLTNNKTLDLWRSFMPRRKEIQHSFGSELYSVNVYDPSYFKDFLPGKEFEKWAAIEVTDIQTIPDKMESYTLPEGLYAVFHYKGSSINTSSLFQYIFTSWLPASNYTLDNRPHFEILGDKYKNNDPDSEEEVWIPITPKL